MIPVPGDLPGYDLVAAGLADLKAGRESETALLVAMAAPRLRALGLDVPDGSGDRPSHRLYELLSEGEAGAHSWPPSCAGLTDVPTRRRRDPGAPQRRRRRLRRDRRTGVIAHGYVRATRLNGTVLLC